MTVFILNWNRIADLRETLRNVASQGYDSMEVLVIDNASDDGSPEMVLLEFPQVRLIRNTVNIGASPGYNQGIREARGQILVKMDNDAVFTGTDAISRLVHEFERDPELGIAAPCVLNYYSKIKENGPYNHFILCAVGFRMSVFERVGMFAERFSIYAEEEDFTIRAEDKGFRVRFLPDVVALHKSAPSQRSSDNGFYLKTRNVFWLFWRNYPVPLALMQTLKHLVLAFYSAIKKRQLRSYLRAVIDAVLGIRGVLQERSPLRTVRHCIIYPDPFAAWVMGRLMEKGRALRRRYG